MGITVWLPEPDSAALMGGQPLWTTPGLLLTPHVAGATSDASRRAMAVVRDQLARYAAGEPLRNVVRDQGY
jgi:phosphoglycerate dehydrogenase-like enzyme